MLTYPCDCDYYNKTTIIKEKTMNYSMKQHTHF